LILEYLFSEVFIPAVFYMINVHSLGFTNTNLYLVHAFSGLKLSTRSPLKFFSVLNNPIHVILFPSCMDVNFKNIHSYQSLSNILYNKAMKDNDTSQVKIYPITTTSIVEQSLQITVLPLITLFIRILFL